MNVLKFKVVLEGEGGCGKSSLVDCVRTGIYAQKYKPTVGVEIYPLVFDTSKGNVTLNVWSVAGQDKYAGLRDGYYMCADAAIVCYQTNRNGCLSTVSNIQLCAKLLAPVVICQTKVDQLAPNLYSKQDCHSSSQDGNYKTPFLEVMKRLLNDTTLTLI